MNQPIIIADLVLSYLGRDAVTLKGDVPGHEFHGNQYSEGGGSGGSESGSGDSGGSSLPYEERRQRMIEEAAPLISKQRAIRKQMLQNVGGVEGYQDDWNKARANRRNKKLLQEHESLTHQIVSLEDKWTPDGKETRA